MQNFLKIQNYFVVYRSQCVAAIVLRLNWTGEKSGGKEFYGRNHGNISDSLAPDGTNAVLRQVTP